MILANSEQLWAEHGLTGLVLLALFTIIGLFFKALGKFIKTLEEKEQRHTEFIAGVIDDAREDRKEDREVHSSSNERLAKALDALTEEIKKPRCHYLAVGQVPDPPANHPRGMPTQD